MAEAAGTVTGKYETLRRLAVGGMGEVFLARERGHLGFSRLVVIKRLLPQLANDRDFVEMFVDEARIVGNLNHPNICQILELGDDQGVPFLALEYVRGESVSAIWDRAYAKRHDIPRAVTLRILADTARALHFAHEARDADGMPLNVIHRDISPHNVMVTFHGDVKLMDFGIARADNRMHRTDTGKIKGKISYMAPEQLRGEMLDRRADVFAVGVMLWELTLNRRLFGGGGEVETLTKAIACDVPSPRSIDPTYPAALEAIVMSALAADRTRRTASAGELATALVDQVAAHGGAERADIATVMAELFPDESALPDDTLIDLQLAKAHELGFRPTAALAVEPSSQFRPTVPLAAEPSVQRPTVPLRTEAPPRTAVLAPSPALPAPVAAARSRWSWLVVALFAVAGSATALILVTRDEPRAIAQAPSIDAAPAVAIDAAVAVQEAVVDAMPLADAEPERIASSEPPKPRPRTKPPRPKEAAVEPPAVTPPLSPPPALAAPPTTGTLAVSSDRIGVVVIDGVRRKSTPFQTELAVGEHTVVLELAEGAGTLKTRATIAPGKKTKCRVENGALACASQ